ncbi:hypothetical protein F3Y22_tig00110450pilonHSYRG00075 [Hibiscus syriacus]|uniref:Uncharacterized protein n=1 Tax=Hibiscus syriacus TaxID=106335 RepID=A0A6A3AIM9_HIBSY|nr:hypothetical protein F3Y22_tig00110450pilonHSYRG00075 [Hibiscus syriacus]
MLGCFTHPIDFLVETPHFPVFLSSHLLNLIKVQESTILLHLFFPATKMDHVPFYHLGFWKELGFVLGHHQKLNPFFGGLRCSYSETFLPKWRTGSVGIPTGGSWDCQAIEVAQIMDQSLDENNSELVLRCIMIADSLISSSPKKLIDSISPELKANFFLASKHHGCIPK